MHSILEGIRVLEWAVWQAGPTSGLMLGDLGADVIKLEHPVTGDPMRGLVRLQGRNILLPGRVANGEAAFHLPNRNKRSIAVDVAKEKGREVIYRLIPHCDVFLQNYRQGVAERVGLDYNTLSRFNPKLVYASISGYGPKGPDAGRRAQDYVGMARSGLLTGAWSSDERELPHLAAGMSDVSASVFAAYGILGALLARERHGIGQQVEVSLLGSSIFMQAIRFGYTMLAGEELPRRARDNQANPLYNHYRCSDGKWLAFAILNSERVWSDFCRALDIPDVEIDPRFHDTQRRFEHCRELIAILDRVFASKTRAEWLAILSPNRRIMVSPVLEPLEVAEDPQVLANDYIVEIDHPELGKVRAAGYPVTFGETPAHVQGPAPMFAQHTEDVLLNLAGYTWDQINELKDESIIP